MLLAPPATAGALEQQDRRRQAENPFTPEPLERGEELLVVRIGQAIKLAYRRRFAPVKQCASAVPRHHTWQAGRALAARQAPGQRHQHIVALADDAVVDPGEGADVLRPHLAVEIRAAEDCDGPGVLLFDATGEGKRRDVLLER